MVCCFCSVVLSLVFFSFSSAHRLKGELGSEDTLAALQSAPRLRRVVDENEPRVSATRPDASVDRRCVSRLHFSSPSLFMSQLFSPYRSVAVTSRGDFSIADMLGQYRDTRPIARFITLDHGSESSSLRCVFLYSEKTSPVAHCSPQHTPTSCSRSHKATRVRCTQHFRVQACKLS